MRPDPGAWIIELASPVPGFRHEIGRHRIQRVPPTERRGRVHTSTVTVAVLQDAEPTDAGAPVPERALGVRWFSGTGCGGQHRNKHDNSVELTHLPTGIARKAETRSRETSMREALAALRAAVDAASRSDASARANAGRCAQIGLGGRTDRRVWRFRDDVVTDAATGLTASCSRAMRGGVDALWPQGERMDRLRR